MTRQAKRHSRLQEHPSYSKLASQVLFAILIMGGAPITYAMPHYGYTVGFDESPGPFINASSGESEAEAYGIHALIPPSESDIIVLAEITSVKANAWGREEATSYGVFSEEAIDGPIRLSLGSISIESVATADGPASSFGISAGSGSTMTMQGGTISSTSSSTNENSTAYGILSRNGSVDTGVNLIKSTSESSASDSQIHSYGIMAFSDGCVTASNELININVTSTSHNNAANLTAYGVKAEIDSSVNLNNAVITVQNKSDHYINSNTVYGVYLDRDSVFNMKDGSITVTATDTSAESFNGDAIGIMTNSSMNSVGTVDITAKGERATGIKLTDTTMNMGGGSITVLASEGGAHGIVANCDGESTTFTGSADLIVTSRNELAIGLQAIGYSFPLFDHNSKFFYGSDTKRTKFNVTGQDAYGIEVIHTPAEKLSNPATTVEVTNGELTVTSFANGQAIGALTNGGTIHFKGTTDIVTLIENGEGNAYSLVVDGDRAGSITIDKANNIRGDITVRSEFGKIDVTIDENGRFEGWVHNNGTLNLAFNDGAVWDLVSTSLLPITVENKQIAFATKLHLDGAHVYVGTTLGEWHSQSSLSTQKNLSQPSSDSELQVVNLSGSGHFYLQTDLINDTSDSVLVKEALTGTHYLHVKATGKEPTKEQIASYLARAEQQVGAQSNAFALGTNKFSDKDLVDLGLYNYQLESSERNNGREWYLSRTEEVSPTAETVLGLSGMASAYAMYMSQLSDLRDRLGEIRYGNHADGAWVRAYSQENKLSGLSGIDFSQKLYGTSFGYDRLVEQDENNRWLFGIRGQVTKANQDIDAQHNGSGDNKSYGFAAYATWHHADGWFADTVISWDRYEQDLSTRMMDGTPASASFKTHGAGFSQEVGRMFRYANGLFAEPQIQLSYYRMKGEDFTTSNDMSVIQDDAYFLTGRIGMVIGKKWDFDETRYLQPYVKMGVNHEFKGEQKIIDNGVEFSDDLQGTRAYYGLGMDWQFTRNARLYAEFEREDGDKADTPWSISASLRIQF